MRKPLEDVRVIALEQYGAGPFGTLHLADLGAEIIKIEDPTTKGDVSRYIPPFQEDSHSLFFETFNRNKKSISLDIKTQRGREVFHDLIKVSDVVFIGFRPIGFSINLLSSISPYAAKVKVLGIGVALITNIDGRKPL